MRSPSSPTRSKGCPKSKRARERMFKTKDGKEQNERIVCYDCKKLGHFESECLE